MTLKYFQRRVSQAHRILILAFKEIDIYSMNLMYVVVCSGHWGQAEDAEPSLHAEKWPMTQESACRLRAHGVL